MKFSMAMRQLMFILVQHTSRSTTSAVEDEDGKRINLRMDDIVKKAKSMDDIVISCKVCALNSNQHINLYYTVKGHKII
jgi:hypothetical protein